MSRQSVLRKLDEAGRNSDDPVLVRKRKMEELGLQLYRIKKSYTRSTGTVNNNEAVQNEFEPSIRFVDEADVLAIGGNVDCSRLINERAQADENVAEVELNDKSLIERPAGTNGENSEAKLKCEILDSSYQIIGDNLDFFVHVKHMTRENQNRSLHWFNLMGVPLRVTGSKLEKEKSIKPVSQLKTTDYIPSPDRNTALIKDMIQLVARIIVKHIPAFRMFSKCIPWHIEHKYSKEMERMTAEVPLGLLMKNESVGADMIDIMKLVQEKYVPCVQEENADPETIIVQKLYFGGDNLTEERSRNLQQAMSDGDSAFECLAGIIPKNEDWHAIRYMYKILYEAFFNEESAKDVGTMCYNMNIVGISNARDPLEKFNEAKEFTNLETDALVVALTLKHFDMVDLSAEEEQKIPVFIKGGTNTEKRSWLFEQIKNMLENYVLHSQTGKLEKFAQDLPVLGMQQKSFTCSFPGCTKEYRYKQACISHEKKVHAIVQVQDKDASDEQPVSIDLDENKDDVFNYACSRINLGLLLKNVDDAVAEGDGERIIRCWQFFLLYYRAYGHHKYAFAAFQLISKVTAILSPAMSEQLVWNRTVNRKGGKGCNISCDLRLEQLNCLTKEMLYNLGVNLNEKTAKRVSNAIGYTEKLLKATDDDLKVKIPKGKHTKKDRKGDLQLLVLNFCTKNIFTQKPGRHHQHYANFDRDLLANLDIASFNKWLKAHLKKLKDIL